MTMIQEWHTSDLTSRCSKRVQLKHEGKALPEVGTAMFRGTLFHAHAEAWHMGQSANHILEDAIERVRLEGRELTAACLRDSAELDQECAIMLSHYVRRYQKFFEASKLIGCEIPLRWSGIDVDGKPIDFATHIDLLFRDPHGCLSLWDWKTGDTDWDGDHAGRSLQVGMMFMAVQYGQILIPGDDDWTALGEAPSVSIVNVENCKPYSRKTTATGDDGIEREFVKGEDRPETSIRKEVLCNNESLILEQFATRVRMDRANLWPTNPTDTGCRVCECRMACPTWGSTQREEAHANV